MKNITFWTILLGGGLLLSTGVDGHCASRIDQTLPTKCSAHPCPNTTTGEDPAAVDIRNQDNREKALQFGSDDSLRWKSIRLYSDSKRPEKLKIAVIRSENFDMELAPGSGALKFTINKKTVGFRIASRPGDKSDVCPFYNIKIIEADREHVVIRKNCPLYEFPTERFHMSVEYFLYDVRTSVMRGIWFAARSTKEAPFPEASPPISLSKTHNGYVLRWSGSFPNDNAPTNLSINNAFTREAGPHGPILVCTDLNSAKGERRENEMCEGRVLERTD